MARPLRIEFPGAVYHVASRGDRREDIFVDDEDSQGLLAVVAQALSRFDAEALACCLMGNHYHLVPMRARMVPKPQGWAWSSYPAHVGQAPVPAWLDTPGLHKA